MSTLTPRWHQRDPSPIAPPANHGVLIQPEADHLQVSAMFNGSDGRIPLASIPLPLVPLDQIRRCATWLRMLFGCRRSRGGFALYLNFDTGQWRTILPPQLCSSRGFRANLRDVPIQHLDDGQRWRLAGSVQSYVIDTSRPGRLLSLQVPSFDGVHVILDPRHFLWPQVCLRINEEVVIVDPTQALHEGPSGFEQQASEVVWWKEGEI